MFKFIKNLFGFGNTEPQETVREILTPPAAPYKVEPPKAEVKEVAEVKPTPAPAVKKVRAISDSKAGATPPPKANKPKGKKPQAQRNQNNTNKPNTNRK